MTVGTTADFSTAKWRSYMSRHGPAGSNAWEATLQSPLQRRSDQRAVPDDWTCWIYQADVLSRTSIGEQLHKTLKGSEQNPANDYLTD